MWKTRDGQFFQRRRHVAGGRAVSLDDIEHEILRGQFAEPRIHFAINCGSNGCPPLRPSAYEGGGLRGTLRAAAEQFLGSEWNCRVDHAARRIFISRIFKMYAEDFAGKHGSSSDYRARRAALRRRAHRRAARDDRRLRGGLQRLRLGSQRCRIASRTRARSSFTSRSSTTPRATRSCASCICTRATSATARAVGARSTVRPDGWYQHYSRAVLDQALATVAADGNIKFYGGEPTLHAAAIIDAMRYLRQRGFRGLFTVFSNGVKAQKLIDILESDRAQRGGVELLRSITAATPSRCRRTPRRLERWAAAHPNRIFQGYKVLFHAGAGADAAYDRDREADSTAWEEAACAASRCSPVKGRFHACPFAAEIDCPHFDLGRVGSDPNASSATTASFAIGSTTVLDPAARDRGVGELRDVSQASRRAAGAGV